ncbi:Ribokinase-like protein [Trichocladium antarcticum]|uniref:Ribokinase-like protein n=1 Tax=Trichocladium antarcticum TaxID=1450529 RepID=A0AAN6UJJ1_9PEZI|nr:Ribokinase-like protein [Trichocladium antarcticum]
MGLNSDVSPDTVPDMTRSQPGAGPDQDVEHIPENQEIDFVTLGMFIIDEIEFPPPRAPVHDIPGGAGTFAALGARLLSPPPLSRTVGWIVDRGSDFPPAITSLLTTWQTSAHLRTDPTRLTTRGWNGYTAGPSPDRRAFRYTTPKRRLAARDLAAPLLQARAVHLICGPARCRALVTDLLARRRAAYVARPPPHDPRAERYARPLIVWEPVPDLCVPAELLNCTNVLPLVDVCSPNHEELAGLMGDGGGGGGGGSGGGDVDAGEVERHCEQLLASISLQSYTLVVRAGEKGCFVARNGGREKHEGIGGEGKGRGKARRKEYVRGGLRHDTDMEALFAGLMQDAEGCVAREEIEIDPGIEKWVPAYYGKGYAGDGAAKVVDPTGGGNTFLGGLAVALARGRSIEEACAWGHVAASFAIEQVGFPVLTVDAEGRETWNGVRVQDRLREFQERVQP